MIARIRLKNWRSYEALDVELPAGTTFVVAPNGVGKTSLVYALAWGVFGDESDIDARACIRAGTDTAEVQVKLVLVDGRELEINRSIARRGRPKVSGHLEGSELDDAAIREVLESSFGVDLAVAARLSMMLGGGHLAAREALNLESHLHRAFGVSSLLHAAEVARSVVSEAEKLRGAVRITAQERLEDRAEIESELTELKIRIDRQREGGSDLQERTRDADRVRRLVERRSAYVEQRQAHERVLEELLHQARTLLAESADKPGKVTADDAAETLEATRRQAEQEAEQAAEAYASARGTFKSANESLGLLSGDSPRCPTCLRPLEADELATARVGQENRAHSAAGAAEKHKQDQETHRMRATAMTAMLIRFEALRASSEPEDIRDLPTADDAEALYGAALEAVDRHNQELGALESRLWHLESQLASDDQLAEAERQLHLAYRREGLAIAAAEAIESAVTNVMESVIEPIAVEVASRWKQLFPSGGLTLRADGSVVRMESGQELQWGTLSGGEGIWARIVTHLLVLGASTNLPFAWFDEPLEHLDPQLRHAVAATLATATQGGAPAQLLVTTYENTIARQLAEDIPESSLINLRGPTLPDPESTDDNYLDEPHQDGQTEGRRAS